MIPHHRRLSLHNIAGRTALAGKFAHYGLFVCFSVELELLVEPSGCCTVFCSVVFVPLGPLVEVFSSETVRSHPASIGTPTIDVANTVIRASFLI
jgi:hypothetical protein